MERISAARAMEWSIELEKALRSNISGRKIEAIEQIGWNLKEWSKEPEVTSPVANMYGLVPGEDRTFANTILLRLADAFKTGDNNIRKSILKIFMLELKHIMKKGKCYNGILAKCRVPNHAELLKRVKVVFDTGDPVGKSLALRLFGCWADLAYDSSHTQYMILLSLQSSHVTEVKASLFTAGCFCRLSEDFAFVVMEVLVNMILSESPFDVKLAAIRAFARLRCSLSITTRAYKAGKKVLASLMQDDLIAEMLSSLSNLVSNSSPLIHEQADLLVSMIDKEFSPFIKCTQPKSYTGKHTGVYFKLGPCTSSKRTQSQKVKARALKCLYFLVVHGASFPVSSNLLDALLFIMEDSNFQAEALKILQKIFCRLFSALSDIDVPEILKVVHAVESVACSSVEANRCLALGVLMDFLCNFKKVRRGHKWQSSQKWHATFFQLQESVQALSCTSGGDGIIFLLWHVTSLAMDYLKSLLESVNPEVGGEFSELSRVKNECKNLFALLTRLAEEYPTSIAVLLDKVRCLVGILVDALERLHVKTTNSCGETNTNFPLTESYHNMRISFTLELIMCIVRFVNACFTILDASGSVSNEACSMIINIIDSIQQSGYGVCNMHDIFLHCLHLSMACHSYSPSIGSTHPDDVSIGVNVGFPHNACFFNQEKQTLDIIKKMIKGGNYWAAYEAGKCACSEGFWLAAAFTFRKLIECARSDSYRRWFKSLILFSGSESEVKLLLFPKAGAELINELHKNSDCGRPLRCVEDKLKQNVEENYDLHDLENKLPRVYSRLCSSVQSLAVARHSDGIYYFQMWFLSLRAMIFEIVAEILGLLNLHMITKQNLAKEVEGNVHMGEAVVPNISDLVDGCVNISSQLNRLAKAYDTLATSFLDIDLSSDFVDRLWGIDDNIVLLLQQLMVGSGELTGHLQPRTQINKSDHKNKSSLLLSSFAVSNILKIQEDAKMVKDEEDLYVLFMRAMQLLSGIVRKWMELPFQLPKYFFKVRPCTGAELFIFNADSKQEGELAIFTGFQLALNICIQLKNAGSNVQVCEMHCIITTSLSHRVTTRAGEREREANIAFETEKIEEMVKLNETLLLHLRSDCKDTHRKHSEMFDGSDTVTTFISFEPNERGQGFSTCLLDVSAFPEGAYQIKWQSCCIDKSGSYWSLLPLNTGSIFTIRKKP